MLSWVKIGYILKGGTSRNHPLFFAKRAIKINKNIPVRNLVRFGPKNLMKFGSD